MLASMLSTDPSAADKEEDDVVYMGVTWDAWGGGERDAPEGVAAVELGVCYMGVRRARAPRGAMLGVGTGAAGARSPRPFANLSPRSHPRPAASARRSTTTSSWAAATGSGLT